MRRIYITNEAYRALVEYCFAKRGTLRGMAHVASSLILKAISEEHMEVAGPQAPVPAGSLQKRPQLPPPPPPPPPAARAAEERRPSKLDDLEDAALIRARNPEALQRACAERGLLAFPLTDLGEPDLYLVCTGKWASFVATAAAGDRTPPSRLEELVGEVVRDGAKRLSPDEKYVLTLFCLNRQGVLVWDGERWKQVAEQEAVAAGQGQERTAV